jgi:hypothetical protein
VKISVIAMGGLIGLGISGVIVSTNARAQEVINFPNFQVTQQVHCTTGAQTSGPFVAASMMGAEGFSNVPPPSTTTDLINAITSITNSCKVQTDALPQSQRNLNPTGPMGPGSVWPGGCNPAGMSLALNAIPNPPSLPPDTLPPHWVAQTWDNTNKQAALNGVYNSILLYHSPAIIPIYGVADHWMAIVDVRTTNGVVTHVRWIDSGPNDGITVDGVGNTYLGAGITTPTNLSNQYYLVLTSFNSGCDFRGCTEDPYYNRFLLMVEPPVGDNRRLPPVAFVRPPAVAPTMNELLAQTYVWAAVTSARVDTEPEVQNMMNTGVAGTASLVNAVYPDGSPWNYYLVPILSNTDRSAVIGYVQLAAADGSFESINFFTSAKPFSTITKARAMSLARSMLAAGERLGRGRLTWDPLVTTRISKSPVQPYYEFEAIGSTASGKPTGEIRVSITEGAMERSP